MSPHLLGGGKGGNGAHFSHRQPFQGCIYLEDPVNLAMEKPRFEQHCHSRFGAKEGPPHEGSQKEHRRLGRADSATQITRIPLFGSRRFRAPRHEALVGFPFLEPPALFQRQAVGTCPDFHDRLGMRARTQNVMIFWEVTPLTMSLQTAIDASTPSELLLLLIFRRLITDTCHVPQNNWVMPPNPKTRPMLTRRFFFLVVVFLRAVVFCFVVFVCLVQTPKGQVTGLTSAGAICEPRKTEERAAAPKPPPCPHGLAAAWTSGGGGSKGCKTGTTTEPDHLDVEPT